MKVLLSIKPEFAHLIFEGKKRYEFRRVIFKNPNVRKVVVYASAPIGKVIGEFEIESILSDDPPSIWNRTRTASGISKEYFFNYFEGQPSAFAIKIKNYRLYATPFCPKERLGIAPPQSFAYVLHENRGDRNGS